MSNTNITGLYYNGPTNLHLYHLQGLSNNKDNSFINYTWAVPKEYFNVKITCNPSVTLKTTANPTFKNPYNGTIDYTDVFKQSIYFGVGNSLVDQLNANYDNCDFLNNCTITFDNLQIPINNDSTYLNFVNEMNMYVSDSNQNCYTITLSTVDITEWNTSAYGLDYIATNDNKDDLDSLEKHSAFKWCADDNNAKRPEPGISNVNVPYNTINDSKWLQANYLSTPVTYQPLTTFLRLVIEDGCNASVVRHQGTDEKYYYFMWWAGIDSIKYDFGDDSDYYGKYPYTIKKLYYVKPDTNTLDIFYNNDPSNVETKGVGFNLVDDSSVKWYNRSIKKGSYARDRYNLLPPQYADVTFTLPIPNALTDPFIPYSLLEYYTKGYITNNDTTNYNSFKSYIENFLFATRTTNCAIDQSPEKIGKGLPLTVCPNYMNSEYSNYMLNSIFSNYKSNISDNNIDTAISTFANTWVTERISSCVMASDYRSLYYKDLNGVTGIYNANTGLLPELSCWFTPCMAPLSPDVLIPSNQLLCQENCANIYIDDSQIDKLTICQHIAKCDGSGGGTPVPCSSSQKESFGITKQKESFGNTAKNNLVLIILGIIILLLLYYYYGY